MKEHEGEACPKSGGPVEKNPLSNFGKLLQSMRLDNGLTQLEAANRLGVSVTAISHWETGRRLPRATARRLLSDTYDRDIERALFDSLEQFSQRELAGIVIDLLERRV